MKQIIKKTILNCTKLIPQGMLQQLPVSNSLFPYHHIVSNKPVPHIQNIYGFKSEKDFIQDLDFLLKHYEPIHPNELYDAVITHQKIPEKKFLLTFDDGFREVIEVIVPILEKKGVPAIFFINPAYINNKSIFYRNTISLMIHFIQNIHNKQRLFQEIGQQFKLKYEQIDLLRLQFLEIQKKEDPLFLSLQKTFESEIKFYLEEEKPWLEELELKSIYQKGFTIGAHSWDHPYYKNLSLDEQVEQTIQSCNYVHDLFPEQNIFFSFPHSDKPVKQIFFDAMKNKFPLQPLYFGVQNQKTELNNFIIHRFNAEDPNVNLKDFTKLILLNNFIRRLFNKNHVKRDSV